MSKLYACIISPDAKRNKAALLSVAREFSYTIELLEDGVLFDVSGLENLIGGPEQLAEKILGRLAASEIVGKVRIADTTATAILLARGDAVPEFQELPLHDLPIEADTLGIFHDLGIEKIRDLQQVPADELIGRYGQQFKDLIDVAQQKGKRLLRPNVKENHVAWVYDLDFPIDDFEQLIFIVNHGLSELLHQVRDCGFSTEHLDISFKLRNKNERDYEVKTSFPTLERTFWLKLVNLRVSLDPPESEIVSVGITSWFTRPRPDQRGLYAVSRPDPEDLLLTVNKIKKLVGENNVGIPVLLDQRLPEAFSLDSDQLPTGRERLETRAENLIAAFNYFRPPIPVTVTVENKRLLFIKTPNFSDRVEKYSGVWKENSYWWSNPWGKKEWDIETENNGVFRLEKNGTDWFLTGQYD